MGGPSVFAASLDPAEAREHGFGAGAELPRGDGAGEDAGQVDALRGGAEGVSVGEHASQLRRSRPGRVDTLDPAG